MHRDDHGLLAHPSTSCADHKETLGHIHRFVAGREYVEPRLMHLDGTNPADDAHSGFRKQDKDLTD